MDLNLILALMLLICTVILSMHVIYWINKIYNDSYEARKLLFEYSDSINEITKAEIARLHKDICRLQIKVSGLEWTQNTTVGSDEPLSKVITDEDMINLSDDELLEKATAIAKTEREAKEQDD